MTLNAASVPENFLEKNGKNAACSHDYATPEQTKQHKTLIPMAERLWGSVTQILKPEEIPDPSLVLVFKLLLNEDIKDTKYVHSWNGC